MRILVTGKTGQLGQSISERANVLDGPDLSFAIVGRETIDLERPETIEVALETHAPDVVINGAAYTAVDQAEDEPDRAMAINATGAGALARATSVRGGRFVQISTDYVFDGGKTSAYIESDPIDPQGVYGLTKAEGERLVRAAGDDHVIVRTAWVYSPFGGNFPKTMLRLAGDRDELNVVDDQFGNPTSALDIADGLIAMCRCWCDAPQLGLGQTFHLAGRGDASWADVAREVFSASAAAGGPTAVVTGIPSSAYPTRAKRPANSRLDCQQFEAAFGYWTPDWRESMGEVVTRLVS